jgi:Subtilase family
MDAARLPCSCSPPALRVRRRNSESSCRQKRPCPRHPHRVRTLPLLATIHVGLFVAFVVARLPHFTAAGRVLLDRSVAHRQLALKQGSIHLLIGYKNERGKQVIRNHTVSYDDNDDDTEDEEESDADNGFTIRNKNARKKIKKQGAAKSSTPKAKHKKKKKRHGRLQGRVPVVAAMITSVDQLEALENDPDVDYIEEDSYVTLLSSEVVPAGISAIQAPLLFGTSNSSGISSTANCSDPSVFKVAIVDSGSDSSHPDSPCYDAATGGTSVSSGCLGSTFGLDSGMTWNEPADSHGTMVTGIIGAVRNNGVGLVGTMDSSVFCLVVARVFASMTANALMSDVLEGMEWAVDQGARVVNLSLGGPTNSTTAKLMYDDLQSRGVLVVSAAGNDGTSGTHSPY